MAVDSIQDLQSLREWLEPRPIQEVYKIAFRSALRVIPLACDQMESDWALRTGATALPPFRTLLTLGVVCRSPTSDVMAATQSAGRATQALTADSVPADDSFDAVVAAIAEAAQAHSSSQPRSYLTDAADTATRLVESRGIDVRVQWQQIQADAKLIEAHYDLLLAPLWPSQAPDWFRTADGATRAILLRDPQTWSFWLRWWDGVLSGNQLDWDLQKEVALIPDAIWQQGPAAVAAAIRQIERHLADLAEPDLIEKDLAALPASPREQIAHFKDTVALHREDIPPTLDALLEYCGREIDRLQGRNAPYSSVEEEEEAQRQIRVLTSIFSTLRKLRETIPSDGPMNDKDAERGERLTRLFVRLIKQWPSTNAEDLVDSVYRAALVGLTATLGPMIGVSAAVATGAGVALFGGKKIADGIKAAKDLGDMASKP
jgi:hypothetical protein